MVDTEVIDWYYITPNTYLIEPVEHKGKHCSLVYDKFGIFYVDKKPLKLVGDTLKKLGTTYKASTDFSKRFFGKEKHKLPIVLSYDQPYAFFPLLSPYSSKNIWIAQHAIINIQKCEDSTIITLKNDYEITLPIHYPSFCTQYVCATMLLKFALKQREAIHKELGLLQIAKEKENAIIE
ncbi:MULTISPECIES: competence protein ComK [Ureibacillus]|jgi:competence protein ComK|uniref:Competence protein ComK n=1 Tax=Ureibacillus thermosphaericus TaxID=51173 RepID=A0A840PYM9_URETH|nr:competence protein ComK [Ureibacillus thermosphaericus]MBB5150414.1 competence protein ComK [Ureibacillus thermosphaericus]NKZ33011.1 hypothetical protein [Ureibacillus thermosphaericus]